MTDDVDPPVPYRRNLAGLPPVSRWSVLPVLAAAGALLVAAAAASDLSPEELVALPVAVGVGVAALLHPLVGLSLLVVMIVANLSSNLMVEFGAPSIAKLAAPGLGALLMVRWTFWGERPYLGLGAAACLGGLLAMRLASAVYAPDWGVAMDATTEYVKDAILAMLALAFMAHRRGFETVTVSAVAAIVAICALGAAQMTLAPLPEGAYGFARFTEGSGRFSGPIEDPNFFGAVIVFALPLAFSHLLNGRSPARLILSAIAVGLLAFGLLATQSRGAIIAAVPALAVLSLGMSAGQRVVTASLLGLAAAVAALFVSPELVERIATIGDLATDDVLDRSTTGRLASWQVAVHLFGERPWLGVGNGNFNVLYQDAALELGLIFRGEGRSAHSLYLEILAEQGLVGLLLFLAVIGAGALGIASAAAQAGAAGHERLSRHVVAFGAGLSGYLVAMAFLHDAYPRFLWIVIVVAVELSVIVRLRLEGRGAAPPQDAPGRPA